MASAFAGAIFDACADQDLGFPQLCEGLTERVFSHFVLKDVQLLEDGLVQNATELRAGLPIELLRVLQERQGGIKQGRTDFEAVVGVLQLLLELAALGSNPRQPCSEFVLGAIVVRGEVVEVLFLPLEFGDSLVDVIAQHLGGRDLVVEHLVELDSYGGDEVVGESDRSIAPLDCVFDVLDLGVAARAGSPGLAATEEVEVFAAVANGSLQEETALMAGAVTPAAPDAAFEVVRVLSQALSGRGAFLERFLDSLEQLLGHKGLMPASVELTVVLGDSAVVGVAQHGLNLRR